MPLLLPLEFNGESAFSGYRPAPAIHARAIAGGASPLPTFAAVGTGGLISTVPYNPTFGYRVFLVVPTERPVSAPFVALMQDVKAGFGRTMTRLPEVFGVSRQTLYNWLDGETPKEVHQPKLRELAEAARVFSEFGFKPTSQALDRTVAGGKSLLQLLATGADGRDSARKLVRLAVRGHESRTKLNDLLGGRKALVDASDLGTPSFDEDV